jgi:hypothetical protein
LHYRLSEIDVLPLTGLILNHLTQFALWSGQFCSSHLGSTQILGVYLSSHWLYHLALELLDVGSALVGAQGS